MDMPRASAERPEEGQSDQPDCSVSCEAELEDVSGHEHGQHQIRRQLQIPSPLRTNEKLLGNTGCCCQRKLPYPRQTDTIPHRDVFLIIPEERQSDLLTLVRLTP